MKLSNPTGSEWLPLYAASSVLRPVLLGGLEGRLLTSDPSERRL